MEELARYLTTEQSTAALAHLAGQVGADQVVQVRNLDYVTAPFELYPLAAQTRPPLRRIAAFTVDMDGTSTTTEPLALHSLEYMVRRFTDRHSKQEWEGLDPHLDLPHVIGNSNFRHTEFLLQRYRDRLNLGAFASAFIEAVCWTLSAMSDPQRRRTVSHNARACGLGDLLDDRDFRAVIGGGTVDSETVAAQVTPFVARFAPAFRPEHFGTEVSAALDIYYMRYHALLRAIEQGRAEQLSRDLLGEPGRHLIEPMPGYDVFLPLIKGWLNNEADALYEPLRAYLLERPELGYDAAELDNWRPRLATLARHFHQYPAKVALVTASISYEAETSMKEVLSIMARKVRAWPVSANCRESLVRHLDGFNDVFDAFVCASDACEHRLKPHPDLYSLALHEMSVPKDQYAHCVGLEDSEPGIIALRAAGVGCAVALPNRDTVGQDFTAATETVPGGLPELVLARNLLLSEERLS